MLDLIIETLVLENLFLFDRVTQTLCESKTCPIDLISPPDDCHVNYTLSFSLQVCLINKYLGGQNYLSGTS